MLQNQTKNHLHIIVPELPFIKILGMNRQQTMPTPKFACLPAKGAITLVNNFKIQL